MSLTLQTHTNSHSERKKQRHVCQIYLVQLASRLNLFSVCFCVWLGDLISTAQGRLVCRHVSPVSHPSQGRTTLTPNASIPTFSNGNTCDVLCALSSPASTQRLHWLCLRLSFPPSLHIRVHSPPSPPLHPYLFPHCPTFPIIISMERLLPLDSIFNV